MQTPAIIIACMMKLNRKIILLFFILLPAFVFSQNTWKKYYSLPWGSSARDVFEMYDNGYIVGGLIRGQNTPYFGYLVKTNINGDKLWTKVIDGAKESPLTTINITTDGGFIIGGRYNTNDYMTDAYVMKLNACAEPQWCSIIPDIQGKPSVVDVGIFEAQDGGFFVSRYLETGNLVYRWSISKLRSNGTIEWLNNYIVDNTDWPFYTQLNWRSELTSDTCLLVCGNISDTIGQTGYMRDMPHWYKVDNNGNLLWETKWNLTEPQYKGDARMTIEDKNGNYYCGGDMYPPLGFSHLYKLSHSGDTIASYSITDNSMALVSHIYTIDMLNDSSLIVGTAFGTNNQDNWWSLNICDTVGSIRIGKCEQELYFFMNSLITGDDKIVVLGQRLTGNGTFPYEWFGLYKFNSNLDYDSIYTAPRTYDSLCPHPIISDTIPMPGNCLTVSLPEAPKAGKTMQLKVYPNPANDFVTIDIPEYSVNTTKTGFSSYQLFRPLTGEVQLSIINLSGQIVKTEKFDASERNHVIRFNTLTPGMYMLHLTQKGKFVAEGKVMVVR